MTKLEKGDRDGVHNSKTQREENEQQTSSCILYLLRMTEKEREIERERNRTLECGPAV